MLIEIAHFLSILSTGLFFICFIFSFFLNSKDIFIINLVSRIYSHSFFIFLSSFFVYVWLAISDNFSVLYIAQHSNINLPVFYKISSIWSAHEGSMFLWIIFLTTWGAVYNLFTSNDQLLKARTLGVISITSVGFLLFLLLTSNPFETILPVPPENGADINPVLQDPLLAIHPPMLYMGYVGFVIAFGQAIAFLFEGKPEIKWEKQVRSWSLASWSFLTLGIALGSWWAYYELGWGGWWFWDPVENASFMPWLVATMRPALQRQGLDLRPDGRLIMSDGDGGMLFSISMNASPADESTKMMTLLLPVPMVESQRQGFEAMTAFAKSLASRLSGEVIDDSGQPLNDASLDAIAAQVNDFYHAMEEYGVTAGSSAAKRLFG